MNDKNIKITAKILSLPEDKVKETFLLIQEGATVPFIARYRKEKTGFLDEVKITLIRDLLSKLQELDERKESIKKSLSDRDLLSVELSDMIDNADSLVTLEDIYLPFKPKRHTKAFIAKEKGLEPLAKIIYDQNSSKSPEEEALLFINKEKDVNTIKEALIGAKDIIAEWINENKSIRDDIRELFWNKGIIASEPSKNAKEGNEKYQNYFSYSQRVKDIISHRIHALFRGEDENILKLKIAPFEGEAIDIIRKKVIKKNSRMINELMVAIIDSYKRLISPSIETDIRNDLKEKADIDAIKVFSENLRELLLAAPLGNKNVLAIDPGLRTGCKLVCLNREGSLLYHDVINIINSHKLKEDEKKILHLINDYNIEVIAIGNGKGSRETEDFIKSINISKNIPIVIVNESGASIYSASLTARKEFPNHDITVRGAVSIGRRLMDPLAELVKIDPKSIGVGQYQHDVNQKKLNKALSDTVVSCVNNVGVSINNASLELLSYVSGLSMSQAKNIISYRDKYGAFKNREELKNVPKLGKKTFEQAIGFLRIKGAKNPLDESAVHPESYCIVEKMAADLKCNVKELMQRKELRNKIKLENYITKNAGLPTLKDIMDELEKPGRDPREKFEHFLFDDSVKNIEDIKVGMILPGIITNVTNFGAFADIGIHQDGLIHISEMSETFIKDPFDIIKVQQRVKVRIIGVDIKLRRINLSLKSV